MRRHGGPEVLRVESVPEPVAASGESLVDVTLAGLNYADLGQRAGEAEPPPLPAVLGMEVVGRRRTDGHRVAVLLRNGGGYAEVAAARDGHTVEIPDGLDDQQAAALLEQGCTAQAALTLAGRFRPGERVLVTAAAGGVGHLALQLARAQGAGRLIGLASTAPKRGFALGIGADAALDPAGSGLVERLHALGGVDLIIDTVGGPLLKSVMRALAPFGRAVSVGWRGGGSDAFELERDLGVSSVGLFGFWMRHVVEDRATYEKIAAEVFDLAGRGALRARIDRTVPLARVGDAHAAMAARVTLGKVLLDVRR